MKSLAHVKEVYLVAKITSVFQKSFILDWENVFDCAYMPSPLALVFFKGVFYCILQSFAWSQHTSSSGKIYYYNCKTEKSQWEKPKEWIER